MFEPRREVLVHVRNRRSLLASSEKRIYKADGVITSPLSKRYLIYQGLLLRLQASRRVTLVKVNLSPLILVSVVRQRSKDSRSFAE